MFIKKIVKFFKSLFSVQVTQTAEAKNTSGTTVNQTLNVYSNIFVGIVLAVALTAFAFLGIREYQRSKYNLSPMPSGKLNVVVVPFSNQTNGKCNTGDDIGERIASAFYTGLVSAEYDNTSKIQPAFRSSSELPALKGRTETELTRSAEELASQINAQIVIYGLVTCTEITKQPSAKVMFFVAPTGFSDAQELIGEFSFSSGALYGNVNAGQEFLSSNENLQKKIDVMSLLVNSLGLYLGEDFEGALTPISAALASSLWESEGGMEVVYIIAGNAEVRYAQQLNLAGEEERAVEEIERARTYYKLANEISQSRDMGEYARAYIGLAGVEHFHATFKSRTSCQYDEIDVSRLDSEKDILEKARQAKNNPFTADILEKIAFNTAQVDLTLYSMSPESVSLEDVEANYLVVISSFANFENPNLRIREMAAHSYAGLAFVNWYQGDGVGVIENFNQAISTTDSPSQQAGYLKSFGNYYAFIDNYEQALLYYKEAASIIQEFKVQPAACDTDINELIVAAEEQLKP